jgi:hypothetical protein
MGEIPDRCRHLEREYVRLKFRSGSKKHHEIRNLFQFSNLTFSNKVGTPAAVTGSKKKPPLIFRTQEPILTFTFYEHQSGNRTLAFTPHPGTDTYRTSRIPGLFSPGACKDASGGNT